MKALIFSPRLLQHCRRGDNVWTLAWDFPGDKFVLLDVRGLDKDDALARDIQFSSRLRDELGLSDIRIVPISQLPSPVLVCGGIGYEIDECVFVVGSQQELFMEPFLYGTNLRRF